MQASHLMHAPRGPSPARLLEAWEAGTGKSIAWRAVSLLTAAYPDTSREEVLSWRVGHRDHHLLMLRTALFGSAMEAVVDCPQCSERLELEFAATDVTAPLPEEEPEPTITWDGRTLRFRLPNADDLLALSSCTDVGEARQLLMRRCSLNVADAEVVALPEEAVQRLARKMAQADPQADVQLALACPACEHTWTAVFDIARYLWAEVDAWAKRMLMEVHTLARAYGWREEDILALSPQRRQRYLDLIASEGIRVR